jgi:hypothetical protein
MKDPYKGIQETDKSFVFYRLIGKNPVTVSLRCGWIWIEEMIPKPGRIWPWAEKRNLVTMTTEDARNLVAAIQELIPSQECEKGPNK